MQLPPTFKEVISIFHPQLVHLDNSDLLPSLVIPPSLTVAVENGNKDHNVPKIIKSKNKDLFTNQKDDLMYSIKYTCYAIDNQLPLWQVYNYKVDYTDLVADLHHTHLNKPKPNTLFQTLKEWSSILPVLLAN